MSQIIVSSIKLWGSDSVSSRKKVTKTVISSPEDKEVGAQGEALVDLSLPECKQLRPKLL